MQFTRNRQLSASSAAPCAAVCEKAFEPSQIRAHAAPLWGIAYLFKSLQRPQNQLGVPCSFLHGREATCQRASILIRLIYHVGHEKTGCGGCHVCGGGGGGLCARRWLGPGAHHEEAAGAGALFGADVRVNATVSHITPQPARRSPLARASSRALGVANSASKGTHV